MRTEGCNSLQVHSGAGIINGMQRDFDLSSRIAPQVQERLARHHDKALDVLTILERHYNAVPLVSLRII